MFLTWLPHMIQEADTFTILASQLLGPLHDQISLTLARQSSGTNAITGCFSYIDAGVVGSPTCFARTIDIFHGETFTRAEFDFFTPVPEPPVLLLLGAGLAGPAVARLARRPWRHAV